MKLTCIDKNITPICTKCSLWESNCLNKRVRGKDLKKSRMECGRRYVCENMNTLVTITNALSSFSSSSDNSDTKTLSSYKKKKSAHRSIFEQDKKSLNVKKENILTILHQPPQSLLPLVLLLQH